MPEPLKRSRRYMPGLDGVRAVAVLGVVGYHLGLGFLPGGLLGVGVFFTLSGYLITDLLLGDAAGEGISLPSFWAARARRLLPALFAVLAVVLVWVLLIGPQQPPDLRGAVLSAVGYVNNWWLILHDVSYFRVFSDPGPLNHLWSLSVEEQFYLVWPLLVIVGVRFVREPGFAHGQRLRLAGVTLALALLSTIAMALLYRPGVDPSRVYYGTDTRASELLIGAALAMVWPSRLLQREATSVRARRTVDGLGALGLLVVLLMFLLAQEFTPFLYRGGFLVLSVGTALVVAATVHPASVLARALGCAPLRWIGARSYGIYLWHFPVIVLTAGDGGSALLRGALQFAATLLIAAASWRYLEQPVRHGALGRLVERLRRRERPSRRRTLVAAGLALLVALSAVSFAGAGIGRQDPREPGEVSVSRTVDTQTPTTAPPAERTACEAVVHIGDSTSEGLVSADYLPSPRRRIAAQYAEVGAGTAHLEVSGARSIYERFEGLPNAREVADSWRKRGFRGCWVLALGTNEAANVAAGSTFGFEERIRSMMSVIDNQPVLWVDVRSTRSDGPYAAENMQRWNNALLQACERYPNMHVFDWASAVKDKWFIDDGIHFTTTGYRNRSRMIAQALKVAFPAAGTGRRLPCLVRPADLA